MLAELDEVVFFAGFATFARQTIQLNHYSFVSNGSILQNIQTELARQFTMHLLQKAIK
jgi:hypothetical protein